MSSSQCRTFPLLQAGGGGDGGGLRTPGADLDSPDSDGSAASGRDPPPGGALGDRMPAGARPEPPPPELPLPPAPAADVRPAKRPKRSDAWPPGSASSPFTIAAVKRGDEIVGWGCVCKQHHNEREVRAGNPIICKRQLTISGGLTSDETRRLLLAWLLEGLAIDDVAVPEARKAHMDIKPRELALRPEAEMAEVVRAIFP